MIVSVLKMNLTKELFAGLRPTEFYKQIIAADAVLLRGFALANQTTIVQDLHTIIHQAPLRHMVTKKGYSLSASMTNCGDLGWISDRTGYRYDPIDPLTNKPWPAMPASFQELAHQAAHQAGFGDFQPDAGLINQYKIGASMGLHQDKNELDLTQPIVSVSLGIPAVFQFGGLQRSDKPVKFILEHGDVVVWGGESRLKFHGILPLKAPVSSHLASTHPALGEYRVNLTFRKAG